VIEDIRGKLGKELLNKTIIHCVTSSVSIYKALDLARLLIKHGAEVIPVLSYEAAKLINPELFKYATGNKPIYKITGDVEHVKIFKEKKIDLVLIAPATMNTISKISQGITDNPVVLVSSIAIGKNIPIIIAPAMHEPMYINPILISNIEKLKNLGIKFVFPKIEEEKAKLADENDILFEVIYTLYKKDLKDKKIIVTAGATREYIDSIRYITNPSSGKMGLEMAKEAYFRGGNVYLIHGEIKENIPKQIKAIYTETSEEMLNVIKEKIEKEKIDYFVSAAGITDYKPFKKYDGKYETKNFPKLALELSLTPKIIKKVKEIDSNIKIIAFKAEYSINEERLKEITEDYNFVDFLIINDVSRKDVGFMSDYNEVIIYNHKNYEKIEKMRKRDLAKIIWDKICAQL